MYFPHYLHMCPYCQQPAMIEVSQHNQGVVFQDEGKKPFIINIEDATERNNTYRTTLWTGNHLQLALMSIEPGEDIGLEMHPHVDQFIRIEEGRGLSEMGADRGQLTLRQYVGDGTAILVPAGAWHNVTNIGAEPLKLYTIYGPPQHPFGTVQRTKADAKKE